MNRHEQQMRDDLAKQLFVAMFGSTAEERLGKQESAGDWFHEASLMLGECFALAGLYIEERKARHKSDDVHGGARDAEEEIEL
jgi:hypothetical protein